MNAETWAKLVEFVHEKTGAFEIPIHENTLIEDGLGCTGGDGIELITEYSKKFNVDITYFVFSDYFFPEPGAFGVPDHTIKPLTVGDLFEGIQKGKLDDSVIGKN
jgi:hypothetical protein